MFHFKESIEDSNDDDQQLQMALQMSLDEISMTKLRNISKSEDNSETNIPITNVQEITNNKTDIPLILPK